MAWARQKLDRQDSLVPYLVSSDEHVRRTTAGAFAGLIQFPRPPSIELALLPLLSDSDPVTRGAAASALTDPASIPALVALSHDPEREVREATLLTLDRLRVPRPTPAPPR